MNGYIKPDREIRLNIESHEFPDLVDEKNRQKGLTGILSAQTFEGYLVREIPVKLVVGDTGDKLYLSVKPVKNGENTANRYEVIMSAEALAYLKRHTFVHDRHNDWGAAVYLDR